MLSIPLVVTPVIDSINNLNNLNVINDNEMLYGLDLNSKFEKSPGLKDIEKIGKLFNLNL